MQCSAVYVLYVQIAWVKMQSTNSEDKRPYWPSHHITYICGNHSLLYKSVNFIVFCEEQIEIKPIIPKKMTAYGF